MMKNKHYAIIIFLLNILLLGCNKANNVENNTDGNNSSVIKTPKILGYEAKSIQLNDLTFNYVEAGTGELIVLLHGFPYFGASWDKLLRPLSAEYHVVAPDNRGYGYTDKPEAVADYKINKLVDDVRLLIKQLAKNKKIILIGHDWGGVLAWGIAQQHPELVSKVIVINAPPFNAFIRSLAENSSQREASRYIPKMTGLLARVYFFIKGPELLWGTGMVNMLEAGHINAQFKQAFLAAWSEPGAVESAINWYKANVPAFDEINTSTYWPQKNGVQALAKINIPSLLIWSKGDKAFTEDTFNEIPNHVSGMQVKILDTDSHTPQIDHSEEVLKYIQEFISE